MSIEVTSVSKKEQKLSRAAAAIFVITQEDIQHSGATNIPDLLRMVPGVDVAQINASTWAISARGLNDEFSNELLVLVDGRNVYTPTFGGVFWDVLDVPLEDIERIEVIRGPGGSVWGANAVNGVINILTKKSAQTKGVTVTAGGGNVAQGFGLAQYGGDLGKGTEFRIYSKYANWASLPNLQGQNGGDGWRTLRGGFRTDSTISSNDTLTVEGDLFRERAGDHVNFLPSVTAPAVVTTLKQANHSGGFLQSIWTHNFSSRSNTTLNIAYGNYEINDVLDTLKEGRDTFEAEFQNHLSFGRWQDFVWGMDYIYSHSHALGDLTVSLNPADRDTDVLSPFVQDEISVVPDRFYLTLGAKVEHNDYTGFGFLPSARASLYLNKRQTVWVAVSHALRTPASVDTGVRFNFGSSSGPGGVPVLASLFGNPHFGDEGVVAYEAGYRAAVSDRFSFDLAAFYNDYDHQQTTEPAPEFTENLPAPVHTVMASTFENLGYGEEHGIEIATNWKASSRWMVSAAYDFARFHMHVKPSSQDTETAAETEGGDPHVHANLRTRFSLTHSLDWDASAYFVDRLMSQGVPSYTRLDTSITWRWREGVSLSVAGQNLLGDRHEEFAEGSIGLGTTQVKRSGFAKFTWQF